MSDIAIIAIGRNEGERLRRCLASALASGHRVIYVDSDSTDGSPALAGSMGADVVELDMSLPFSAARARNAGFEKVASDVRFVQFVDGDCEIVEGWIERAGRELEQRPDAAVVCGRRRERFPEKSIYNRLADLEWATPIGEAKSCGGDSMMRVDALRAVGGFDASIVAGEEPELCQRLGGKGWRIVRVDAEMTLHDAAMLHFSQWWRRAVRSGYGAMDVATRFGAEGLFAKQVRSARIWAVGFPLVVLIVTCAIAARLGIYAALIAVFIGILAYALQVVRVAWQARRRTGRFADALIYGILTMSSKWANMVGQLRYWRDRRRGRSAALIEYKRPTAPVAGS